MYLLVRSHVLFYIVIYDGLLEPVRKKNLKFCVLSLGEKKLSEKIWTLEWKVVIFN